MDEEIGYGDININTTDAKQFMKGIHQRKGFIETYAYHPTIFEEAKNLTEGSGMVAGRKRVVLLAFKGEGGDRMMFRLAKNISSSLSFMFLPLHTNQLLRIRRFLEHHIRSRNPLLSAMAEEYKKNPFSVSLLYLQHSILKQTNPTKTLLYLHGNKERMDLLNIQRAMQGRPDMIAIVGEGSMFNPDTSIPLQLQNQSTSSASILQPKPSATTTLIPQLDEILKEVKFRQEEVGSTINIEDVLEEFSKILRQDGLKISKKAWSIQYPWVMDQGTGIARILLPAQPTHPTPPSSSSSSFLSSSEKRGSLTSLIAADAHTTPSAIRKHSEEINRDIEYSLLLHSYSIFHETLKSFMEHSPDVREYLDNLPMPQKDVGHWGSGSEHLGESHPFLLQPSPHNRTVPLLLGADYTLILTHLLMDSQANGDKNNKLSNETIRRAVREYQERRRAAISSMDDGGPFVEGKKNYQKENLNLNEFEEKLMSSLVRPGEIKVSFSGIGALPDVKERLYELITLRLKRPELFERGILKETVSGILLFGPPGTGKTMLAKAVASESGANFLNITHATIFDKYVGESEKNVRAIFSLARKLSPCVIFIDEVDGLFENRGSGSSGGGGGAGKSNRIEVLNDFMAEWDGLRSENKGVTVMAATNRPNSLDDAVLRRLPRRIMVDLPDEQARLSILSLHLRDDLLDSSVDLEKIAKDSVNYSGSDLKNLAFGAANRALSRLRKAEELAAGNNGDLKAKGTEKISIVIKMEDFDLAFKEVPPSTNESMQSLLDLRDWSGKYGDKQSNNTAGRSGAKRGEVGFLPFE